MTRMIEYDDNLYFINERVKLLQKGAALDIDPDIFSDQFAADMKVISRALLQIREQIDESTHTLERSENLRSLMLANQKTMELAELLTQKGYLSREQGESLQRSHREQAESIEDILTASSESPGHAEQISPEEFEFLLKEENEENEETP